MSNDPIILEPSAAPPPELVTLTPGPLHFSTLKRMSRSPMHVHHALTSSFDPTRDMRIGTIVHHMVCGPHNRKPLVRYDGDRRQGNGWEAFKLRTLRDRPDAEIVTAPEWAEAEPIAAAVLGDPLARGLISGSRREVALRWKDAGIDCETDGIDGVNEALRLIWDLKVTNSSEPSEFARTATRLHYPAQMKWFETAAHANGIATDGGIVLIAVESSPPYPVTCLACGPEVLEYGQRLITLWLERYRGCSESAAWPGYVQRIVPFELPAWAGDGGDDE